MRGSEWGWRHARRLAAVHGWCTEGLDTAERREANVMVDERS